MGDFIVGILIGVFVMYNYAFGAYTLGKQQKQINKNIRKDLDFYKNLSDKYEEQINSKK